MEHTLDVSNLEPCEPLELTLSAVRELPPGDYLKVLHRREPNPLFSLLEKSGFSWICRPGLKTGFEIYIWHDGNNSAKSDVEDVLKPSC
ncbi:MAG: DUF2249 domain-containing protein [Gammaproteobacteria bacterium]|nr:DUF2249 domain-containing protein [Gammaproteobacteria bacterium]